MEVKPPERNIQNMKKDLLIKNNFYHIYNRGVDKRIIFNNEMDYKRFIFSLFLFNDDNQNFIYPNKKNLDLQITNINNMKRKPLIDILQWTLMPNHFHLLVRQREEVGISQFMQKLGTGYTLYFNNKQERTGRLFQGSFKAKLIETDSYLTQLAAYIVLNPIKLIFPNYKEKKLTESEYVQILQFLNDYKWSSYNDYFGKEILSDLTNKDLFLNIFGGTTEDFKQYIIDNLKIGG
ncbi:MAG: Transposase [Parcubacteria group bacterium GW2011_GWC2_39_14]|nr:MAG: Transposase [Parcubacteria group bacterium GW2011_GWC2_39_14]